jgi:hypothetical protein
MKKFLIATVSSLALLMAGVSYAAQDTAPKDNGKPPQEMKKDTKKASKKKCPEGQVYSKQDKKCVAKTASTGASKPAGTAPAK